MRGLNRMTVYARGVRLVWAGLIWFVAFLPVMWVAEAFGIEAEWAFVPFALAALFLSAKNLMLACPNCGKNPFRRGIFFWYWPEKICGSCGADLDAS